METERGELARQINKELADIHLIVEQNKMQRLEAEVQEEMSKTYGKFSHSPRCKRWKAEDGTSRSLCKCFWIMQFQSTSLTSDGINSGEVGAEKVSQEDMHVGGYHQLDRATASTKKGLSRLKENPCMRKRACTAQCMEQEAAVVAEHNLEGDAPNPWQGLKSAQLF
ncbi:hypothetical protein DUI87_24847 [Hirundo rustica rustica]|uniref:Uncharacterized protein n=1 Tax=Hirundo rustica rustica TaxID=333673 RepID=A0A3M0JE70_HIRRU|nr:hypothetical protein DUI87_24847 [Hirundo rustica rustica]